MNAATLIVLAVILLAVGLAVRSLHRQKKSSGCSGCCGSCKDGRCH